MHGTSHGAVGEHRHEFVAGGERLGLHDPPVGATVRAYDPANVLARGYSITRGADGRIVQAESLAPGDELVTVLADGTVRSTVHGVDGSGQ